MYCLTDPQYDVFHPDTDRTINNKPKEWTDQVRCRNECVSTHARDYLIFVQRPLKTPVVVTAEDVPVPPLSG